jgi:glycerol-3-phosphate acyltransferase PlsY
MIDALTLGNALALLVGYLLGSVPFGLVLTRLAGLGDIRAIGSGNIGATNVLRTGRRTLAALTLLGDALKGTVAVVIGSLLGGGIAPLAAGLGAFLGHLFPAWLGFKGGKGVATYLGVLVALSPLTALVFAATWMWVAALSRFSSLSALIASLVTPPVLLLLGQGGAALLYLALTAILWARHSDNIARLVAGTETRIGQRR